VLINGRPSYFETTEKKNTGKNPQRIYRIEEPKLKENDHMCPAEPAATARNVRKSVERSLKAKTWVEKVFKETRGT